MVLVSLMITPLWAQEDSSGYEYSAWMQYRASETRYFDLLHTDLQVSFDWERQELIGLAVLELRPYFYAQEDVTLDAKAMEIKSVVLRGADGQSRALTYEYDDAELHVLLGRVYERTDTLMLAIEYIAKPNEWEAGGSEAITSDKGLYFINADGTDPNKPQQIWTQGETEASSIWFPTIDAPNERCTQQIAITVQNKYNTLSNGLMIDQQDHGDGTRTDTWRLEIPHAPYLFMMAVGEYAVIRDQWREMPLAYHVEKDYAEDAQAIFGHTPEMIELFSQLFGVDYPWPKYDQIIVRDFVSGAMENTTASVFMERAQVHKKELLDYNWDDYISHELSHQWFGDYVTCESWSNLTLNEGFASYAEYLWNEHKYGLDEADYNLLSDREVYFEEASDEPKELIRYYYEDQEDMFDSHSYNKGAAVIHMLRNYLGDDAFFLGIKEYLTTHALESVEIADLRVAFEKVCGEDLNWFFDQWFFFEGHPEIIVSQLYEQDTLTLTVQQVQGEESPIYKLPLFIDIWSEGKSQNYPVILEDEVESYQFYLPVEPDLVVFDSERQLLAEVTHAKSAEEYAFQMKHSKSYQSRQEAVEALFLIKDKKIQQSILTAALQDPFYAIQQSALDYMIAHEVKPKKYAELIDEASQNESSKVRSYALRYLAEDDFEEHRDKIQQSLDDPSYLVQSVALASWVENGETLTSAQLKAFSAEDNINILLAMSEYYNLQTDDASYDWYVGKFGHIDEEALYYLLQSYAEKLVDAPEARKAEAVKIYNDIAREHASYIARLSAFQGLLLMSDVEGVDQMLDEIKAEEKDQRLQAYYDQF
ncbi:hypothetical protein BFP72_14135 [Reichenbachiella sp. 5M10]|nr:hypothetical protein BFP72_14135 [Reichenbachiella sp. 5M10]